MQKNFYFDREAKPDEAIFESKNVYLTKMNRFERRDAPVHKFMIGLYFFMMFMGILLFGVGLFTLDLLVIGLGVAMTILLGFLAVGSILTLNNERNLIVFKDGFCSGYIPLKLMYYKTLPVYKWERVKQVSLVSFDTDWAPDPKAFIKNGKRLWSIYIVITTERNAFQFQTPDRIACMKQLAEYVPDTLTEEAWFLIGKSPPKPKKKFAKEEYL